MRFRATLQLHGKTATGFEVPNDIVDALGAGRKPKVRATVNGHTWRTSIAFMGGVFLLGVSADNRTNAGLSAGDVVDVDVELDTDVREVGVPADLAAALAGDAAAKAFFDGLSYSQQRWYVLPVEDAKTAETRARRVAKALDMLRAGRTR